MHLAAGRDDDDDDDDDVSRSCLACLGSWLSKGVGFVRHAYLRERRGSNVQRRWTNVDVDWRENEL